jgi:type IV secretion system protein VirD4
MIVMGAAALSFLKKIFIFVSASFHTSAQINLINESYSISDEYGASRLARCNDPFIKDLIIERNGFYIGSLEGFPLFYDPYLSGNGHILTYAPSRTGKTISAIIPALMHWFGGSLCVTDIKGELTFITAYHRKKRGQNVIVFNPFNVLDIEGLKFNPLQILLDDVLNNRGRDLFDLAQSIAHQLISEKPNDMGDGAFFRGGARRLLTTFLLYLPLFMPENCNLPNLRKLVWATSEKQESIAYEMQTSNWLSGLLQDYGNALAEMLRPEYIKTFGAFRDNAMGALEIYNAHSPMGKAMSSSDFSLEDVLDGETTLYLILPEAKLETHGGALGLITTLLLETIAARPKPAPIMMLLEEMGNIGKLPNLSKALSLLPRKGVHLWMVFQSRRQPIEIYGQQMAGLIEEQSSLVQAWSIRGELDRKAWSLRIGNQTKKARSLARDPDNNQSPWRLNISERASPVMSIDEIGRMDLDQQLIAIDGQMVIKADRLAYFQIEPWRSSAEKSPYHEKNYPKNKPVLHKLSDQT